MSNYDYEGEMEKARIRNIWRCQPNAKIRHAWVIKKGKSGFLEASIDTLSEVSLTDGSVVWVGRITARKPEDIFETELEARNELETRLYKRLLELQKHREAMTKLLVACAFPVQGEAKT